MEAKVTIEFSVEEIELLKKTQYLLCDLDNHIQGMPEWWALKLGAAIQILGVLGSGEPNRIFGED